MQNDRKYQPGERAEITLSRLPEAERLPFLAKLEQDARREGDLEALREIRAYRAKASKPTSTTPPSVA